ncbi:MAG: hypothetical protein AABW75_00275 [Nanoarchaeota archaeon]
MDAIIETDNPEKAKQAIKSIKNSPIIIKSKNLDFDRKLLEYGKFDILLDIEKTNGKNTLRYINSGLNHVLARIASKNNIALGIDLLALSKKNKKEKAELLTKIKQNIKICRKAGVKIKALFYKDKKDVMSLFQSLGASSQQAIESTKV